MNSCATTTVNSFTFSVPTTIISNGICQILSQCFNVSAPVGSARKGGRFTILTRSLLPTSSTTSCGRKVVSFNTVRYAPRSPGYLLYPLTRAYRTLHYNEMRRLPIGGGAIGIGAHRLSCVCVEYGSSTTSSAKGSRPVITVRHHKRKSV